MPRPETPTLHTPIDLPASRLDAVVGSMDQPALLDGGDGFGAAGRWSVYAAEPSAVFESDGEGWTLKVGERPRLRGEGDPLAAFGRLLGQDGLADPAQLPPDPDVPPFRGGWIGYFGYDIAPMIERLPRRLPADSRLPVIRFARYDDWAISIDHANGQVLLSVFPGGNDRPRHVRIRDLTGRFTRASETLDNAQTVDENSFVIRAASNFGRGRFQETVERALEYIRAGDVFQVNLAQRFEARGCFDSLGIYRRLKRISPAPYAAYLAWDDLSVISSSPELFYQTRGDHLVTRPIKGTRPRGATATEDDRLARELSASAKDRAELTMIVDLERNDLGRVCRYGSIHVREPLVVESYAQVHHLVATVEGRLRPGFGPIDVVRALHPGGSITGAPKIRAMEIIDELEPCRRGVYTGAIGYFTRGASAFNIAIRTILLDGERATYHVGGGIVADSVPEQEYEETLHKGRGMRAVLEGAGP